MKLTENGFYEWKSDNLWWKNFILSNSSETRKTKHIKKPMLVGNRPASWQAIPALKNSSLVL